MTGSLKRRDIEAFYARWSIPQRTNVHWYKPDTFMEMEQKETEMWQETETKTQQSNKAILLMAHLGIWLQSRHRSGVHPSLLCTFREYKEEETVRRAVIQQVWTRIHEKGKTTWPKESGVGAEGEAVTSRMSKTLLHLLEGLMLDTILLILLSHVLDFSPVKSWFFTILSWTGRDISKIT